MSVRRYQPFYCEENVWWLAQEPRFAGRNPEVLFVTNATRTCALFHQRAASTPAAPVVWDYHVVLAVGAPPHVEVWDLDCTLGMPLAAGAWLRASFGASESVGVSLRPVFRVVDADTYVATFCSDRGHMRERDGTYLAPPPAWPCIGQGPPNLERFLDLDDAFAGALLDRRALEARFSRTPVG